MANWCLQISNYMYALYIVVNFPPNQQIWYGILDATFTYPSFLSEKGSSCWGNWHFSSASSPRGHYTSFWLSSPNYRTHVDSWISKTGQLPCHGLLEYSATLCLSIKITSCFGHHEAPLHHAEQPANVEITNNLSLIMRWNYLIPVGCGYLASKIQEVHSWSNWNFWFTAMLKKTCILLQNSETPSLQLNDPAQVQWSAKCAALIWWHFRHTRSWRWYSLSLCRTIWIRAFSIASRS